MTIGEFGASNITITMGNSCRWQSDRQARNCPQVCACARGCIIWEEQAGRAHSQQSLVSSTYGLACRTDTKVTA